MIPAKFTFDGDNVNPELKIDGIPEDTKTFVLIVDDTDAPSEDWVHWLVRNIKPTNISKESSTPGVVGRNDFNENKYLGPSPPSGTHNYYFKIYALGIELNLDLNSKKSRCRESDGKSYFS